MIVVPDNTNTLHQLQACQSGGAVAERWKRRARGWMGYDCSFHSAYVRDVDRDGELEVMVVNPERQDCSELLALASGGKVKHSWAFARTPPPAPTRIGLYEWVVVSGDHGFMIAASSYASHSMNSEETVAIDLQNKGSGIGNNSERGNGDAESGRGAPFPSSKPPAGGRRFSSWRRISSAAWMRSPANGYGNPGYSGAQPIPR